MSSTVKTCLVVGLGLIGGSLAAALREARLAEDIVGVDTDAATLHAAVQNGIIDRTAPSAAEAVGEADLVILAIPVRQIAASIRELGPLARPGTIFLDVGSTKAEIVAAMDALPADVHAIGGHPMTGALTAGVAGADAALFAGRTFVLTPARSTDDATRAFAEAIVQRIGARLVVLDAQRHDLLVAVISHLPRLLPVAQLASADAVEGGAAWPLAAGGFRESTRKATDNLPMWVDVALTNKQGILAAIESLHEQLRVVAACIEASDETAVRAMLAAASDDWQQHFG